MLDLPSRTPKIVATSAVAAKSPGSKRAPAARVTALSGALATPKTADAKKMLSALAGVKGFAKLSYKKNAALIAVSERTDAIVKSFRNIGSVEVDRAANLNPVSVLKYKYVIMENPEVSVGTIAKRIAPKNTN